MIGELWAVNHGGEHRFDAEDLEFLSRLGNFVRAAHRLLSSMNEVNEARRIPATGPRRNVGSARWDAASPSAQSVEYQELRDSINEAYCVSEVAFDVRSEVDDYVILDVNPAFERVTGMEEAVGSKLSEVDFREDHRGLAVYRQIARTGRPQHFDMPAAFSRVFSGYAFRIGEPRQHCVVVPFKDMMDRARLEHALRASEAQQAFLRRFGGRCARSPIQSGSRPRQRALGDYLVADCTFYAEFNPLTERPCLGAIMSDPRPAASRPPSRQRPGRWSLSGSAKASRSSRRMS